MKHFLELIRKTDLVLYVIAGAVLVGLVLVTLCDVILRNFGHPIMGSMEIIQYGGCIVFAFSIPYATFMKAQILVDIVTAKLKPRAERAMAVATRTVGVLLFLFASYNFYLYGLDVRRTGEVSAAFSIPYYPIVFALAFSFLLQGLTVLHDLITILRGDAPQPEGDTP
jgi:TRAP-type C4-dicarboxylate transport system permease small subunit